MNLIPNDHKIMIISALFKLILSLRCVTEYFHIAHRLQDFLIAAIKTVPNTRLFRSGL